MSTSTPPSVERSAALGSPFSIAALLGLSDEELAEPLSRHAPPEQRWEQLSLRVTPESGKAMLADARSGAASSPPESAHELVPGLDAPGAVEMPVYMAGRALSEFYRKTTTLRPPVTALYAVEERGLAIARARGLAANRRAGPLAELRAALTSGSKRLVRTAVTVLRVPGEFTRDALTTNGRRRYLSTTALAAVVCLLFTIVTALGSLRPRPDRALRIGGAYTREFVAGAGDRTSVDLMRAPQPNLLDDIAVALDTAPLFWLPLMACFVIAALALLRVWAPRESSAETHFAVEFCTWFVLWWSVAVPAMLFVLRVGFEVWAALAGVERVPYADSEQFVGVPPAWLTLRQFVLRPALHSGLLAVGLLPWTVSAYRRTFHVSWPWAALVGVVVVAIPLVMLLPFT